jgi:hypothetical protein
MLIQYVAGDMGRIFDIPSLPSSIFRGREDVLKKMEQYFHNAALTSPSQLTFAICGLGMKVFPLRKFED